MNLVTLAPGRPTAIVIDEKENFGSFACDENTSWKGILVPNIAIELDENATFDPVGWSPPLGMLPRNMLIPIATGLPSSQAKMAVGFKKWQITIGDGLSKRILMSFDTERRHNQVKR